MKNSNYYLNQLWSIFEKARNSFHTEELFPLLVGVLLIKSCNDDKKVIIPPKAEWTIFVSKPPSIAQIHEALKQLVLSHRLLDGIMDYFRFTDDRDEEENRHKENLIELIVRTVDQFTFENPEERRIFISNLIHTYHSQKGKGDSSESSSPSTINKLSQNLLDFKDTDEIYDPCFGVCTFLDGHRAPSSFWGNEIASSVRGLAIAAHFIAGYRNFDIILGDSLLNPILDNQTRLKLFDKIVSTPPFNLGLGKRNQYDDLQFRDKWKRFSFGFSPDGNWMFAQHALSCLKAKGKASITMPLGALFKIGVNKEIRQTFVENGHIETVILLPDRLFDSTSIPCCIVILTKEQRNDGKILFIKADTLGKVQGRNRSLSDEEIIKIAECHKKKQEIDSFSRLVSFKEIKENEFNLLPNRYFNEIQLLNFEDVGDLYSKIAESGSIAEESKENINEVLRGLGIIAPEEVGALNNSKIKAKKGINN